MTAWDSPMPRPVPQIQHTTPAGKSPSNPDRGGITMLIVNGVVHTMETGVIPQGFVHIQGGRIARTGPMSDLPKDEIGRAHV